jgi:VWFA-related protein
VTKFARPLSVAFFFALLLTVEPLAKQPPAASPPPQQQQPPPPPQPPPRFRTETNFVRVDVFATKDGVPVQDLTAADFELVEDNAPQKIESFEHIVVSAGGPQESRTEPASVTRANEAAADPRRRVFVLFLDNQHVGVEGSHAIKEPLIELMTRIMGDDDLVGVMTPDMSPSHLTFGRRTEVIERGLRENWPWGRRTTLMLDEREELYSSCFPPIFDGEQIPSNLAKALIERRRERIVLDSLQDLIRHMGAVREGRTAVITVSDGWKLFRPDESLTKLRKNPVTRMEDPVPGGPPPVGVGPGGGLTSRVPGAPGYVSDRTECEKDQMDLALADNERRFRDLFGEANRANVSFYPIDPRGLPVWDTPLGPDPPLPRVADAEQLRDRIETLETLALNTDGIALVNSNDLRKHIRRMADDLTSYYLLGYRSTNTRLDGGFRTIKVRSKRPGIEIRARRGYRAPTPEDVARARAATDVVVPEATAALNRALGSIERAARAIGRPAARKAGEPVVLHRGPATGNQIQPAAGRVFARSERIRLELEAPADVPRWTGVILDRNGNATPVPVVAGERSDGATGQRWLTADITLAPLGPGDYVVELTMATGSGQQKTLTAIRVTQ